MSWLSVRKSYALCGVFSSSGSEPSLKSSIVSILVSITKVISIVNPENQPSVKVTLTTCTIIIYFDLMDSRRDGRATLITSKFEFY